MSAGSQSLPTVAWLDGEFVAWDDARIHVDTQTVLGGLNAYEVIAGFWVGEEAEVYLLRAAVHLGRLRQSGRLMRIPPLGLRPEEILEIACQLVARNGFQCDVLVRIVHYLGSGPLFSYRSDDISSGLFLTGLPANPDPPYRRGIHVATSHWVRLADLAAPPRVKCGANYHNQRLAQVQAQADGYDDAILLNGVGKVCELPLANLFVVRDGVLITPSTTSGILEGITRRSIIEFVHELGIDVVQREVDRSELYLATEAFACGTGREIWPILSVDRYQVGDAAVGPITSRVQDHLHRIMRNQGGHKEWLTPAYRTARAGAAERYPTERLHTA